MRGRLVFLMMVVLFFSCEDPTTLPVSKIFSGNKLQTAYVDTFSVVTSTVQLDSVLTSGTRTMLLGRYRDSDLGYVSSSTYFQVGYNGAFLPDVRYKFDSIALILPYTHNYSGDTTVAVNLNVYELTQAMQYRVLPGIADAKVSVFNVGAGFFNSSVVSHKPTPIVSANVKFMPHKDSLYIKLPDSFGANWFRLAQIDSGRIFSSVSNFITNYFHGLHINVDPSTNACVVGFRADRMKIRLYYRALVGDYLKAVRTDFSIINANYQFNHIDHDRSGTQLASAQTLQKISTSLTNNTFYVQSGTGLVARLDFPSLKGFFSLNEGIILNAAFLEVYPVRGSYPKNFLPIRPLQLFSTDGSNIPLAPVSSGSADIIYDYQFGQNTVYRYQLYPYLFSQLRANTTSVGSLILAPSSSQGGSVQRVYFGDRFHAETKIKLKIYYSYAIN